MKIWTPEDDAKLRELFADASLTRELRAEAMGVSVPSARDRAKRLGLSAAPRSPLSGKSHSGKPFTAEEDARLIEMAAKPENSFRVIAEAMGMSRNAIIGRAHRLGVNRGTQLTALCKTKALANSHWTADRAQLLVKLVSDKLSASEIAIAMNLEVSRQAIVEKCKRMGLELTPYAKPAAKPRPERTPRLVEPASPVHKPPRVVATVEAPLDAPRLRDLGNFQCRYPIGDVPKGMGEEQRFCGAPLADDYRVKPYCHDCAEEARHAVQPTRKVTPYEPNVIFRRPQREAA